MGNIQLLLTTTSKTVFTVRDLGNIWNYSNYESLIRRIKYYRDTGKLRLLKKGYYSVVGRDPDPLELGNKLRTPSYISFETVLRQEGIIFQWDDRITLASIESIALEIGEWKYLFRQLNNCILYDTREITQKDNYFIASKERALMDILYIDPNFAFDNLKSINFKKCEELLPIYDRDTLNKVLKNLKNA